MGQPPAGAIVDAEIIEDTRTREVRPHATVGAAAAEMVTALTEVAFRDAQADEWIVAEPGSPDAALPAVPEPARLTPSLRETGILEPVRVGPPVLDADSWDTALQPLVDQDYQGRRRAGPPPTRVWVVIGLVVAALSAAIAVPWVLTGDATPQAARTPGQVLLPADDDDDVTDTASPGATVSSTGAPLPPVGASPLVTSSAPPEPTSEPQPSAGGGPPPPFSATIQAEAGGTNTAWGGTAFQRSAGGATVIDRLGDDWDNGDGRDNWLEFRNIAIPATGSYRVRIWYVYGDAPATGTRTIGLFVNGSSTAAWNGNVGATATVKSVDATITINAGTTAIRVTHSTTRCPAIDRIEITRV